MGRYALQDMLRIRTMREESAGKELMRSKEARESAKRELDNKRRLLEDFLKTKDERREKLFNTVMKKLVKREQLEILKENISKLDEEELLNQEAVNQAKAELDEKEQAVEKARVLFVIESKNLVKIQNHKEAWEQEDLKQQERLQDAEMEEFTGKRNTNDDYDDFE